MRALNLLVGLGLSFSLAACGSGDEDPMTPPGSGEPPPGSGEPPPGGGEPPPLPRGGDECNEEPGTVYEVAADAAWENDLSGEPGTHLLKLAVNVDGSADDGKLSIDLYEGAVGGGLEDGMVAGTYPLEGTDLDLVACGICVYATGGASAWAATGGTFTIEEIDAVPGGAFRMSLTGVTLGGLDSESQLLPDCTVSLADTTIEDVFAGAGG